MTSHNKLRERAIARTEQFIFDGLPSTIRAVLNECNASPPKPSVVRDALLRGVSERTIIETIKTESRQMKLCSKCKKYEVERFDPVGPDDDGYESPYCSYCNDREIEKSNERREWNYYHGSDS